MTWSKPITVATFYLISFGLSETTVDEWPWALVLGFLMIWISIVDIGRFEIPDTANAALGLIGAAWAGLHGSTPILIAALFASAWFSAFVLTAKIFRRFRQTEGLGFGDVKLIFGLSLWLGPAATPLAILIASLGGLGIYGVRWLRKEPLNKPIPFGPFLCFAAWLVWLEQF